MNRGVQIAEQQPSLRLVPPLPEGPCGACGALDPWWEPRLEDGTPSGTWACATCHAGCPLGCAVQVLVPPDLATATKRYWWLGQEE